MTTQRLWWLPLALGCAIAAACASETDSETNRDAKRTPAPSDTTLAAAAERPRAVSREGSTISRSPSEAAVYIADEDHRTIRRVKLPADGNVPHATLTTDGHPAQVLALADRVLVTLRDPGGRAEGALLSLRYQDSELREVARTTLPADAWGIAISPDERTALISSAWSHQISAVDLASMQLRWSIDVAREPRGVVIASDGETAYVTHLVGAPLTRIDGITSEAPSSARLELPAAPLRAQWAQSSRVAASLGYAATLSPDGGRLFVARHALGAAVSQGWSGASTVDVMLTADDSPLAPRRTTPQIGTHTSHHVPFWEMRDRAGVLPSDNGMRFVQPRAIAYRKRSHTLLVASEGKDQLVELDALAISPAMHPLRSYQLGQRYDETLARPLEGSLHVAAACGAPSGMALSEDESRAYVWCRSTYDLAIVRLDPHDGSGFEGGVIPYLRLADDPLDEDGAIGRRLFYSASDFITSGGMGCAGCHPDGRDDGFVWHEESVDGATRSSIFVSNTAIFQALAGNDDNHDGVPRRTPMLAGRVDAVGPYGWHAESATLEKRIVAGFRLHRWSSWGGEADAKTLTIRGVRLARFLREGLVAPARPDRALSAQEQHGRALFMSARAQCSECHLPTRDYGHNEPFDLRRLRARRGYRQDPNTSFKVPNLRFVAATAPYLHDGSAATLEALIDNNHDRMGRTSHLSRDDRAALVAFLRTL